MASITTSIPSAAKVGSIWRVSAFGALTGLEPPERASKRWAIIPYGILSAETGEKVETRAGVDFRYQITSNLGADVTFNPDFALVEADVERINLTRFELSLPEKRPFFLEGLEVFRQRIRQVYTRRIGDMAWGGKLIDTLGGVRVAALAARADLEQEGLIQRHRKGRRNHYELQLDFPLRHPLERNHTVEELVELLTS